MDTLLFALAALTVVLSLALTGNGLTAIITGVLTIALNYYVAGAMESFALLHNKAELIYAIDYLQVFFALSGAGLTAVGIRTRWVVITGTCLNVAGVVSLFLGLQYVV